MLTIASFRLLDVSDKLLSDVGQQYGARVLINRASGEGAGPHQPIKPAWHPPLWHAVLHDATSIPSFNSGQKCRKHM